MTMNLRPLDNKVILKRLDAEGRTPGGIVLPDIAKEKPQLCKVLAVGPGRMVQDGEERKRMPVSVSVGQTVIIGKHGGQEIVHEGCKLLVVSEDVILAALI
jgi:chaperonin GroES